MDSTIFFANSESESVAILASRSVNVLYLDTEGKLLQSST